MRGADHGCRTGSEDTGVSCKLYCHIGMQKAGSKAIQHFSVDNREALGALGITYARNTERGVWHRKLFTEYDDAMDDKVKAIMARHDTVVLSFERAYLAPKLVIARLAQLSSQMHVLFVVREPVSWLNSWINQIVKAHRSTYQQFLSQTVDTEAVREALDVDRQLMRWEEFAGRERITVVDYNAHDNVIEPYMDWLGIDPALRDRFTMANDDPNRALDEASLRVFLEVKRRAGEVNRIALSRIMQRAHDVVQNSTPVPSEPFRLVDDEMAQAIVSSYQPAFERVMARYGGPDVSESFEAARRSLLQRRLLRDFEPSSAEVTVAEDIIAGR